MVYGGLQSAWYDDMRIYALDRVEEVQATETRFKLPKGFDAKEFLPIRSGLSSMRITRSNRSRCRLWAASASIFALCRCTTRSRKRRRRRITRSSRSACARPSISSRSCAATGRPPRCCRRSGYAMSSSKKRNFWQQNIIGSRVYVLLNRSLLRIFGKTYVKKELI